MVVVTPGDTWLGALVLKFNFEMYRKERDGEGGREREGEGGREGEREREREGERGRE